MASWRPKGSSPGTPGKREGSKIYPWSKRRMDSVDESEMQSPSTADIVAAQSQDYVDERELEFRQTIQHLAGECFTTLFFHPFTTVDLFSKIF
ncbi:uncharacterized protein TNIN_406501 [Trichonephila inaurata madagascariensis]|uniref:Uncharacterized protein n=1 Tax=Trichonephila inaurata madagascariensis TaxID=2747483 RepID=A0A8X6WS03_9ARAC|nr:uncharacterized protein TNIN_406501 [Trichonephila inaurata madagascariensis]